MKELHRLLARQLRRYLPENEPLPHQIESLLEAVNNAYYENDEDRRLMERSLELSSQELLQSNAEMRAVFQALPDHYFRIDAGGTVLDYKSAGSKVSPLKSENPIGRVLAELLPGTAAVLFEKASMVTLQDRTVTTFEYSIADPEETLYFEGRLIPLFADQLILILRDITKRKKGEINAQERAERIIRYQGTLLDLSKSEQQNFTGAIGNIMAVGIRTLDSYRISLWLYNQEKTKLICQDLCTQSGSTQKKDYVLDAAAYPDYFSSLEEVRIIAADDVFSDPRMTELADYFRDNGIYSTMDIPIRLDGRVEGILCIDHAGQQRNWSSEDLDFAVSLAQMISLILESRVRKTAEEALKDREANLRTLFLAAPVGIAMQSFRRIRQVNQRLCTMLGYEESELVDKSPRILYETSQEAKLIADTMRRTLTIKGVCDIETRWIRKDGTPIDVLLKAVPLDVSDLPSGVIFTALDITERKRVENALASSEKRFRNYFELSMVGITITTPQMAWIEVNDKFCDMLGYTRDEIENRNWNELRIPEEGQTLSDDSTDPRVALADLNYVEMQLQKKDGSRIHALVSSKTVTKSDSTPDYILTLVQDVTDRKRLEAQLLQSQKMESIGTLAGGIAHDFNNLLMGIEGFTSLILYDLDTSHPHYEKLRSIEEQVRSGAELTKQLLGFARGGKYEAKPTNINNLIDRSSQLFGRTRRDIVIEKKLYEDVWTVEVDRGQLEQVLLNLYVNAWQAMPAGGALYLQTDNVDIDMPIEDSPNIQHPGSYVRISVTDTGIGMDQKTKERIFDPFFTTKDRGRGTGLGLASAYGIIKNHGGFINVYSEKGQGTTFNIYLPRSDKKEITESRKVEMRHSPGKETILVVDDEDLNVNVTKLILNKLGYSVITAGGGKEALAIIGNPETKIDLVILDMVMPEMSGGETYELLRLVRPSLKCILASGYSINGQATNIMKKGVNAFIQKPFTMSELAATVRRVLDGGADERDLQNVIEKRGEQYTAGKK
ncbi:MAG: PAS domain S-box protein [Syntrophaceae bacterium]|nr:PAS domain S-box protein [Syntrophaceae bacterium]